MKRYIVIGVTVCWLVAMGTVGLAADGDPVLEGKPFGGDLIPDADNASSIGSASFSLKNIFLDGTAYINNVDINGGAIDGVVIGADDAQDGYFDNLDTGSLTLTPTDDPAVHYDPATAGESEWWTGVNHDADGVNDDPFEIRQSATPNTNVRMSIATTGEVTIPASTITESGTEDFILKGTRILNDTGAADASEDFIGILVDVTETDTTGWDEVNLMDLRVGGTSKFKVDNSGNITTAGSINSVNYKTIRLDAASFVPCTTNGAAAGTYEYATNDIDVDYYAFDSGATEERVQAKLVMPEDWDRSTVKVKFYWTSATGSTVTEDQVSWAIKAGALSNDDALDAALGTAVSVEDTLLASDGADLQVTDATGALTIGGTPALGDLVVFEIFRDTDGSVGTTADDMTEDAWLLYVVIQYATNNTAVSAW